MPLKCSQKGCDKDATHKVYWPGEAPLYACEDHMKKTNTVAHAIGFHVTFERLESDDE